MVLCVVLLLIILLLYPRNAVFMLKQSTTAAIGRSKKRKSIGTFSTQMRFILQQHSIIVSELTSHYFNVKVKK